MKATAGSYLAGSNHSAGQAERDASIIGPDDPILITGASGFIGRRLVKSLLARGFRSLRCCSS